MQQISSNKIETVFIPFKSNIDFECKRIMKLFLKAITANKSLIVKLSAVEGAIVVAMDVALHLQSNFNDYIDRTVHSDLIDFDIRVENVETAYADMDSNITGNCNLRAKIEISLGYRKAI